MIHVFTSFDDGRHFRIYPMADEAFRDGHADDVSIMGEDGQYHVVEDPYPILDEIKQQQPFIYREIVQARDYNASGD